MAGATSGYSGTPLPKKLGITAGDRLAVVAPPAGFAATLGELPDGVRIRHDARGRLVGLNTWTRMHDGAAQGISLPSETMRVLVDAIRSGTLEHLDEAVLSPPAE